MLPGFVLARFRPSPNRVRSVEVNEAARWAQCRFPLYVLRKASSVSDPFSLCACPIKPDLVGGRQIRKIQYLSCESPRPPLSVPFAPKPQTNIYICIHYKTVHRRQPPFFPAIDIDSAAAIINHSIHRINRPTDRLVPSSKSSQRLARRDRLLPLERLHKRVGHAPVVVAFC